MPEKNRPRPRRGFTLTEILVVIGIIVLALGLAVPVFNVITGSNSVAAAENTIAATLGRARGLAIGMQEPAGVLLYVDPGSGRTMLAIVRNAESPTPSNDPNDLRPRAYLELATDVDPLALPPGVSAQVVDNAVMNAAGTVRQDDAYLGYNTAVIDRDAAPATATALPYGGVILFDATGATASMSYAFKTETSAGQPTAIATLLYGDGGVTVAGEAVFPADAESADRMPRSSLGVVLFDREPLTNRFADPDADPQFDTGLSYTGAGGEIEEEAWLDEHATPLMVNRYTGAIVRGE